MFPKWLKHNLKVKAYIQINDNEQLDKTLNSILDIAFKNIKG